MSKIRIFDPSLNDSFEHMFRRFMTNLRLEREIDLTDIRVDVVEKNGLYKVRADLPGVKKDDITVRVDGNIVQIDAQASEGKEFKDEGNKVLRNERYWGALSRTFTLAQDVDESKVVAKYCDGVLSLELPKKVAASTESKLIKVQ